MGSFISFLENNTTLLLFLVIAIGYILAKIKIKGFSLGISSVLFVGLAFGSLSEKLIVPDAIFIIGLIFFIYTTGLQSGPGFFASFNRVGMGYNLLAVICLFITAAFVFILRNIIDLEPRILAGLYSGALTNTPAIASIVDSLKLAFSNLPESEMNMILGEPVAGFSIAYPFGVLGVIFAFQIFKFLFKINVEKESREIATELGLGGEELENRDIKVIQKEVIGKSIQEIFQTKPYSKFLVSRIKKNDQIQIVTGKTILEKDDIITVVGSYAKIEEYSPDFGVYVETTISSERGKLDYRRIFVSNKDVIGISIRDLNLREKFDATITRLKRGDSEIVPTQDTILLAGDRIRVVARKKDMENVTKFFGDSFERLSEVDYISIALGIALGLLLGEIPIPIPGGGNIKLGFAGGPLIVSLILGKIGRTGKFVWVISYNSNHTIRQLGVVLFLAGIGLKAGYSFGVNIEKYGLILFAAGAIITLFNTFLFMILARIIFKTPYPLIIGMTSGMQTQPACVAYANSEIKNSVPGYGYALVFPISMIAKILLGEFILKFLK